jgi:hypothetical protein
VYTFFYLELTAKLFHHFERVFSKDGHLAHVTLAHRVALEAVLVSALLLAHFAIPSQLLQPLRLDAVGDGLGGEKAVL